MATQIDSNVEWRGKRVQDLCRNNTQADIAIDPHVPAVLHAIPVASRYRCHYQRVYLFSNLPQSNLMRNRLGRRRTVNDVSRHILPVFFQMPAFFQTTENDVYMSYNGRTIREKRYLELVFVDLR